MGGSINRPDGPRSTVTLIEPEIRRGQAVIQSVRQRLVTLVSGPNLWRAFVGGGFAVLVGAITLVILGPAPSRPQVRPLTSEQLQRPLKLIRPGESVAPPASNEIPASPRAATESDIQLTVTEHSSQAGQHAADYMDPFIESNRVTGHTRHANFASDGDPSAAKIRQVSQTGPANPRAAWLSGTIEAID